MLVKFFKRGNTAEAKGEDVLNYLLGGKWAKDNAIVRENARLLRGNPYHTTEIINQSPYKKKYLSGCLSFHSDEKIDDALKEKLMDDFEQCLLPSLDPAQYSCYWVEHTDKIDVDTKEKRLELNFVFATTELTQNKKLNVYYHYADVKRIDLWQSITNFEHDLSDPKDPIRTAPATMSKNHSAPQEHKSFKQAVHEFIEGRVRIGEIYDRQSLINVLQKQGYELSRIAKTSISIRNPDGKNIRLKGEYYHESFTASEVVDIPRQKRSELWHQQRQHDMPEMRAEFEKLMKARETDLLKRHPLKNIYADYADILPPSPLISDVDRAKDSFHVTDETTEPSLTKRSVDHDKPSVQNSLSNVNKIGNSNNIRANVVAEMPSNELSAILPTDELALFDERLNAKNNMLGDFIQGMNQQRQQEQQLLPSWLAVLSTYPLPSPFAGVARKKPTKEAEDDWTVRFGYPTVFNEAESLAPPGQYLMNQQEIDNDGIYITHYRATYTNWLSELIQVIKRTTERVVRAIYDYHRIRMGEREGILIGAMGNVERAVADTAKQNTTTRTGSSVAADIYRHTNEDDIRFKFKDDDSDEQSSPTDIAVAGIDSVSPAAKLDMTTTLVAFEQALPSLMANIRRNVTLRQPFARVDETKVLQVTDTQSSELDNSATDLAGVRVVPPIKASKNDEVGQVGEPLIPPNEKIDEPSSTSPDKPAQPPASPKRRRFSP